MKEDQVRALVEYRLEQADEALRVCEMMLRESIFRTAINRAYYAMFYGVLALLAATGRGSSKHTGTIGIFDREFVKTGVFDKEFSVWLHEAFDLRQRVDYREMFAVSKERAEEVWRNAKAFVEGVRARLSSA